MTFSNYFPICELRKKNRTRTRARTLAHVRCACEMKFETCVRCACVRGLLGTWELRSQLRTFIWALFGLVAMRLLIHSKLRSHRLRLFKTVFPARLIPVLHMQEYSAKRDKEQFKMQILLKMNLGFWEKSLVNSTD